MPRGPKPQSLELTKKHQKLYDANVHLTFWAANRYAYTHPTAARDEVLQACRIGLTRAILKNDSIREMSFTSFAIQMMLWECGKQLFGCCAGVSATTNARKYELSGDAPVTRRDGGSTTRGVTAEYKQGRKEMQEDHGAFNLAARQQEIREAFNLLSKRERRLLNLKFFRGLDNGELASRLGLSRPTVVRAVRSGIAKLRIHFADQKALPPEAPLPPDGGPTKRRN